MEVDEIICAAIPEPFLGVGLWYEDFSQTTDQEVRDLLEKSASKQKASMKKESQAA
jgi:putative phosphoribosyl transferase